MLYKSNGKHVSFEFIRVKEEASISFEKNHFDLVEICLQRIQNPIPEKKKERRKKVSSISNHSKDKITKKNKLKENRIVQKEIASVLYYPITIVIWMFVVQIMCNGV